MNKSQTHDKLNKIAILAIFSNRGVFMLASGKYVSVELTIDNSVCELKNLSIENHKTLRKLMSYKVATHMQKYQGARDSNRYLMDKRGRFPTGLLYIALKYIKDTGLKVVKKDIRVVPSPHPTTNTLIKLDFEPYPEQREAADVVFNKSRGIVCAPTGVGKSVIIGLMIQNLRVPTLVVVPTLELKRQLIASLKSWFPHLHVSSNILEHPFIAVCNIDSMKENELHHYNALIVDEFHHSGATTYRRLNAKSWKNIYYKYGLTATPFRSQDHERLLLESVLSTTIYKVEYQTAVDKGYIVPMEAFYVDLPRIEPIGNTSSWASMYSELVVNNEQRNKIIALILKRLKESDIYTICLVKEISHGENIKKIVDIPFINGQSEDSRLHLLEFLLGEQKQVIGTTGVLGEGVDTKPAEFIILAGLGKSKNAFMQMIGRGFRNYPGKTQATIIFFRDKSHRWTQAHFREQVKILKDEYNIVPKKLELDFSLQID